MQIKKLFIDAGEAGEKSTWKTILVNIAKLALVLAGAVFIAELLRDIGASNQSLTMVYFLPVAITSYMLPNYAYGITAAIVSTLACDYLVTAPRMTFAPNTGLPITLVTMLAVTFIISTLTTQSKAQARLAGERERRAELLREMNHQLLAARDIHTIMTVAGDYLFGHLNSPIMFYVGEPLAAGSKALSFPPDAGSVFSTETEIRQVRRIFKKIPPESAYCVEGASNGISYIPLRSAERVIGVIGISRGWEKIPEYGKIFIQMLTGQLAFALELRLLSDEQSHLLVEAEKEKMRGVLLRSISHDLRTPLTSILGASSAISEQDGIDTATVKSLARDIQDDAGWLIRMVENILAVTRISGEHLEVKKEMEAAEEILTQAADIVRKRFPDYFIHAHIPEELLLVPMDATLISQVIINLLENAVKNSEPDSLIMLTLEKKGDFARFTVSDNGRGISEELLGNLFEARSFAPSGKADASRGIGIGLSICKTIVQAHGGTIEGSNRENGGASFSFLLPLFQVESVKLKVES